MSTEEEPVRKRIRGVVNDDKYKRNVVRKARVKGESYVSYSGKQVPAKQKPNGVTCKCQRQCDLKITETVINEVWDIFHQLEDKNSQDTYIQSLIEVREVQRRRGSKPKKPTEEKTSDDDSGDYKTFLRNYTYKYFVNVEGEFKNVCKNIFMKIHGISRNRLARICHLLNNNMSPEDKRGQKMSGNAIPAYICELISLQIAGFEVMEIPCEEVESKKYLDSRLSVKKMHEMFINDNPTLKDVVKYNFYYKYFKDNFGYSFGRP